MEYFEKVSITADYNIPPKYFIVVLELSKCEEGKEEYWCEFFENLSKKM